MRNVVIGVIIVIILAAGAYLLPNQSRSTSQTKVQPTPSVMNNDMESTSSSLEISSPSATTSNEVVITGSNFKYDLTEIRVKQGETVKITFKDSSGNHDLQIPDFNVGTKVLNKGQQETLEFIADKKGTFEFFCSVGNHRAMGMKGN